MLVLCHYSLLCLRVLYALLKTPHKHANFGNVTLFVHTNQIIENEKQGNFYPPPPHPKKKEKEKKSASFSFCSLVTSIPFFNISFCCVRMLMIRSDLRTATGESVVVASVLFSERGFPRPWPI